MKLIIAGTRDIELTEEDINFWVHHFNIVTDIEEVVSGNSGNVDLTGERWSNNYLNKQPRVFAAPWEKMGGRAGPFRNQQMADYADALLVVWDGKSSGSLDMKIKMLSQWKPVYEVVLRAEENAHFKEYNTGDSEDKG